MDVVGPVGHCRAELPIRNPPVKMQFKLTKKKLQTKSQYLRNELRGLPVEAMVVKEKDAAELAGGIEVAPVDSGSAFATVEDEVFKRRV